VTVRRNRSHRPIHPQGWWLLSLLILFFLVATLTPLAEMAQASDTRFPNDPYFYKQWAMNNTGQGGTDEYSYNSGTPDADIDAPEAWAITTGSPDVVVGVIDEGIGPDAEIVPNMWSNPGGVNGCPAGTHGYNARDDSCYPTRSGSTHGNDVSNMLGAAGNNGVMGSGVLWTTRIVDLRVDTNFLIISEGVSVNSVVKAINWAISAKQAGVNIRVLNMSFGGEGSYPPISDAVRRAGNNGILSVAASGDDSSRDNDSRPVFPCSDNLPSLICVGGTDNNDRPAFNWGAKSVHLSAPAAYVYYCSYGTSCSSPLVAGAAALVLSKFPDLSVTELKSKILNNVDVLPSLKGKNATSGRLNLYKALTGPIGPPFPPPATSGPGEGASSSSSSSSGGSSSGLTSDGGSLGGTPGSDPGSRNLKGRGGSQMGKQRSSETGSAASAFDPNSNASQTLRAAPTSKPASSNIATLFLMGGIGILFLAAALLTRGMRKPSPWDIGAGEG
jgi:serine protease